MGTVLAVLVLSQAVGIVLFASAVTQAGDGHREERFGIFAKLFGIFFAICLVGGILVTGVVFSALGSFSGPGSGIVLILGPLAALVVMVPIAGAAVYAGVRWGWWPTYAKPDTIKPDSFKPDSIKPE